MRNILLIRFATAGVSRDCQRGLRRLYPVSRLSRCLSDPAGRPFTVRRPSPANSMSIQSCRIIPHFGPIKGKIRGFWGHFQRAQGIAGAGIAGVSLGPVSLGPGPHKKRVYSRHGTHQSTQSHLSDRVPHVPRHLAVYAEAASFWRLRPRAIRTQTHFAA